MKYIKEGDKIVEFLRSVLIREESSFSQTQNESLISPCTGTQNTGSQDEKIEREEHQTGKKGKETLCVDASDIG